MIKIPNNTPLLPSKKDIPLLSKSAAIQFDESKHKRDEDGKFAEKEETGQSNNIWNTQHPDGYYIKNDGFGGLVKVNKGENIEDAIRKQQKTKPNIPNSFTDTVNDSDLEDELYSKLHNVFGAHGKIDTDKGKINEIKQYVEEKYADLIDKYEYVEVTAFHLSEIRGQKVISKDMYEDAMKMYKDIANKYYHNAIESIDRYNTYTQERLETTKIVYRGTTTETLRSMIDNNGEVGHLDRMQYTENELNFIPATLAREKAYTYSAFGGQDDIYGGMTLKYDLSEMDSSEYKKVTYEVRPRLKDEEKEFIYDQRYGGTDAISTLDNHEVHLKKGSKPIVTDVILNEKPSWKVLNMIKQLEIVTGKRIKVWMQ